MALKPSDIRKPGVPGSLAGGAKVSPQNLRQRLTRIKDPRTAEAMGKVAGAMKDNANELRQSARQTKNRHNELASVTSESAKSIGEAKRAVIKAKKDAEIAGINSDAAAQSNKAIQEVNKVKEQNVVNESPGAPHDPMQDITKMVGGVVAFVDATQKAREDIEFEIDKEKAQLEAAKLMATNKAKYLSMTDGTGAGIQNASAAAFEDLDAIITGTIEGKAYANDPAKRAELSRALQGYRTNLLSTLGTASHNEQMDDAFNSVIDMGKEYASLAYETGDPSAGIAKMEEFDAILKEAAVPAAKRTVFKRGMSTAIMDKAFDHYVENKMWDEADEFVEKTVGSYKGSNDVTRIAYQKMADYGVNLDQGIALMYAENDTLDPTRKNPIQGQSASGILQQIDRTFRNGHTQTFGYPPPKGGSARDYPVEVQAEVGFKVLADELEAVRDFLGVSKLTDGQFYFAHLYGQATAKKVLSQDPDTPVIAVPGVTQTMLTANGWINKNGSSYTVGQVEQWAAKRMDAGRKAAVANDDIQFDNEYAKYVLPETSSRWAKELRVAKDKYLREQISFEKDYREAYTASYADNKDVAGVTIKKHPRVGQLYQQTLMAQTATNEDGSLKFSLEEQRQVFDKYAREAIKVQTQDYGNYYYGRRPSQLFYKLVPKAQVDSMIGEYKDKTGEEVIAIFNAQAERWGDHWPVVANQIAAETKSDEFKVAMMFDRHRNPNEFRALAEVFNIDMDQLKKKMPDGYTLTGKSDDSIETVVRSKMSDFREAFIPPISGGQTGGNVYDSMVNSAIKMTGNLVAHNQLNPNQAADKVVEMFKANIGLVDSGRTKLAVDLETLQKNSWSIDEIEEGTDALYDKETFSDLLGTYVAGAGDPGISRALREPLDMIAEPENDIGDYIQGIGKGADTPALEIDRVGVSEYAVKAEGQSGHYGMFTNEDSAISYASALANRARQMVDFDRDQTIQNFVDFGKIIASPDNKSVEFLVSVGDGTGWSPMYGLNGEPLRLPYEDVVSLARR